MTQRSTWQVVADYAPVGRLLRHAASRMRYLNSHVMILTRHVNSQPAYNCLPMYITQQGKTPKNTSTGVSIRSGMQSGMQSVTRKLWQKTLVAPCWTLRPEHGDCTDRSDVQLILLWICCVFLFPCQAFESGLPVAASPVPAFGPAWLQGHTGITANHSIFGPSTRYCQTPDPRHALSALHDP